MGVSWACATRADPAKDLKAAEIKFVDERGWRLDLHALRATFCTMLAVNRVPLNEAMHLMRHSYPNLTMKVYTDSAQLELSAALASLPSMNLPLKVVNS